MSEIVTLFLVLNMILSMTINAIWWLIVEKVVRVTNVYITDAI